jgi:folate-binding Fe-S cluster repair protein YgfZ
VHYEKGCYLGQEAMAKIHFRGKVNRRLAMLEADGPLTPGAELRAGEEKVGKVTSASNGRALALVKHTAGEGTEVVTGSTRARIVS